MRAKISSGTALFCLVLCIAAATRPAAGQVLDADRIRVGLRTDTLEEDGFIDRVLAMVSQGRLPVDLVESTFLWARKQPRHRFQYFRRGLILRAGQIGVSADEFDPNADSAPRSADPRIQTFTDLRHRIEDGVTLFFTPLRRVISNIMNPP